MSDHVSSPSGGGYRFPDGRVPILVSSDAAELVAAEARALGDYLRGHPDVSAAAIGEQLLRTRPPRRYRALVLASDAAQLTEALDAVAEGRTHPAVIRGAGPARPRRVAYAFPGQGGQRPGMGSRFYELSTAFRRTVDACHEQSLRLFGASARDYVLGDIDSDDPAASDVRVVQPALFIQMAGLAAMWDAAGAVPAVTVGHSQGEIAAAYRSGAMTLSDALTIVTVRARLVHELSPRGHTMAVVGIDVDECEAMLARHSGWAQLSVVNSAHILCISGRRDAVLDMVDTLTAQGRFAREIRVEYPAHTSVVSDYQPAFLDALGTYLEHDHMMPGDIPCVGATLGEAVDESMSLGDYWFWNLRNRVRFDKAIENAALVHRADFFIEMSEHPTLLLAMGETLSGIDSADAAGRPIIGTSRRDADGLDEFTRNVAALAVADTGFRWDALTQHDDLRSGPAWSPLEGFPNTIMRRVHLWADRDAGLDDEVNSPAWAAARSGPAPQRLVARWQPLKRRKLLAPRTIAILDPTGQGADDAARICAAADAQGATAFLVDEHSAQRDDIDTAILLLGPPGTKPADVADAVASVLANRRWSAGLRSVPAQFWWVTVGGESVVDTDPVPDLVHGSITAALRCAAAEYPGVRFRHLDLGARPDADAARLLGEQVISAVHVADEPELAMRDGLFVKRLAPAEPDTAVAQANPRHVLITGGTGQVGMEFCEHYARAGAHRITLVSRSGAGPQTTRRIDALRRRVDTVIDVVAGDIADELDADRLADMLTEPVTLLVHTAMNYVAAGVDEITAEQIVDAERAKVTGLRRLLAVLPMADDVHLLLCSSIAATLGGREQALYALTNRTLGIMAAELRDEGRSVTTVEWGLWRVQGPLDDAGVARVEGAGVVPMSPASALATGLGGLGADSIVAAADWAQVHDLLTLFGYQRVLGDLPDAPAVPARASTPAPAPGPVPTAAAEPPPTPPAPPTPPEDAAAAAPPQPGDMLRAELAVAMGLPHVDDLDPELPLVALGLDSLQALDFRRRVKTVHGHDLPVEAILGGASLREVIELMR
ncbi:nocobactin polyketide synthase NbtC [Gordonia sp. NPDC003424]